MLELVADSFVSAAADLGAFLDAVHLAVSAVVVVDASDAEAVVDLASSEADIAIEDSAVLAAVVADYVDLDYLRLYSEWH